MAFLCTGCSAVGLTEGKQDDSDPEWFRDEDEEYSAEADAVIRRVEKKIDKIAASMDIDFDGYIETPTIGRIESKLEGMDEALAKVDKIDLVLDQLEDKNSDTLREVVNEFREVKEWLREFAIQSASHGNDQTKPPVPNVVPIWVWIVGTIIAIFFMLRPSRHLPRAGPPQPIGERRDDALSLDGLEVSDLPFRVEQVPASFEPPLPWEPE